MQLFLFLTALCAAGRALATPAPQSEAGITPALGFTDEDLAAQLDQHIKDNEVTPARLAEHFKGLIPQIQANFRSTKSMIDDFRGAESRHGSDKLGPPDHRVRWVYPRLAMYEKAENELNVLVHGVVKALEDTTPWP